MGRNWKFEDWSEWFFWVIWDFFSDIFCPFFPFDPKVEENALTPLKILEIIFTLTLTIENCLQPISIVLCVYRRARRGMGVGEDKYFLQCLKFDDNWQKMATNFNKKFYHYLCASPAPHLNFAGKFFERKSLWIKKIY